MWVRQIMGWLHGTVRSLSAGTGISKSAVHRYIGLFGLQPHRTKSSKRSTDPFFVEKVRDVGVVFEST